MNATRILAPLLALGMSGVAYAEGAPGNTGNAQGDMPNDAQGQTARQDDDAMTDPTAMDTKLSDGQIAAVVESTDRADIETSKLAKSKTKNNDVKDFANTMIQDRQSIDKQAKDLVSKLGTKAERNDTSRAFYEDGKESESTLKKLKGAAFDKAYVDHEVAFDRQVLDTYKKTLIPDAKSDDLKAFLMQTTPVVQRDLDHAKQLQAEVSSTASR